MNANRFPLYLQRFQRLSVDKALINYISKGGILVLEIEEWVNKLSGRASVKISKVIDNEDLLISESGYYYFGISDLNILFPWAEFEVDEDYYRNQEEEEFTERYGIWDSEERGFIGTYEDFEERREKYPKIRSIRWWKW